MEDITISLNIGRNALMLAAVCSVIIGLISYIERGKGVEWYVSAFRRFFIWFFLPIILSLASAVSELYSFLMASVFFTLSCLFLLLIIITVFFYLLYIPIVGEGD